jgi:FtsH-binding integral membrane protein
VDTTFLLNPELRENLVPLEKAENSDYQKYLVVNLISVSFVVYILPYYYCSNYLIFCLWHSVPMSSHTKLAIVVVFALSAILTAATLIAFAAPQSVAQTSSTNETMMDGNNITGGNMTSGNMTDGSGMRASLT